ncbi:2-amino-4-hydroxy-6-hydroxymethyldihydropteridine diphosphokinase [Legionella spiritensis]|uniref:2-amino-4-hydroxy-6- hydroxymethyldihydropteridine diphosphokinase n=1 Tax=Legionella spiritensis TaxID=452 RepID=UPI000F6F6D7D|nr:2-amino-4-hydroxy-6-hydroxymethyldihydropteridine diphosphokinase [Legionella spiritensis]VEG90201.1 2-amino-4-hydroxy-6-hydroxymethyldihydropteridinepyrophosphokinase [Legionella spiritensis]
MTDVYLALGSNLRSPQRQIRHAINAIRLLPQTRVVKTASFYHNEAWGRKTQPKFCNTVVAIQTKLPPQRLLQLCHRIETRQGRCRRVRWGARTVDIDLLLYGDLFINTMQLQVPHPGICYRDFVYIPLLEIAPQVALPNGRLLASEVNVANQSYTFHKE